MNSVAIEEELHEELSTSNCSVPIVQLNSDVLEAESVNLLSESTYVDTLLTKLPVCWLVPNIKSFIPTAITLCVSILLFRFLQLRLYLQVLTEEEQNIIAATPAHPAGLYGRQIACPRLFI